MSDSYLTVAGEGTDRLTEQRSVFIGYAAPCETEAQTAAMIERCRRTHSDARHCVYAYVLRADHLSRFTDDREPSGTAGMPVLDILRHASLTDTCLVVVRYFGGILLGTGGLVRCYSKAAQLAVAAAGVVRCTQATVFSAVLAYNDYTRIQALMQASGTQVLDTDFAEQVTVQGAIASDAFSRLAAGVRDATNGSTELQVCGERFLREKQS